MTESSVVTVSREAFVRAWVEDLRSGKYEQGKKALKTADGKFCCLGVACETAVRLGIIPKAVQDKSGMPDPWFYQLMEWFDDKPNFVLVNGRLTSLICHNDQHGHTFEQIADGLEAMFLTAKTP